MVKYPVKFSHSLVFKLILCVGTILLISISTLSWVNISYQKEKAIRDLKKEAERLSNTIMLGAHYAMMHNSRNDIHEIIINIAKQRDIENIRIFNKTGQIKYSSNPLERDQIHDINDESCVLCHRHTPPLSELEISQGSRFFDDSNGYRFLSITTPIYNAPGCSDNSCHIHSKDKKILGSLDVVLSLTEANSNIFMVRKGVIWLGLILFIVSSAFIFLFVLKFVKRPINNLIAGTQRIAKGDYSTPLDFGHSDELGQLSMAINSMQKDICETQAELNDQFQFQNLFDQVPCIITVQDRDYRLVSYNREFSNRFAPEPGDYCYEAYKGRSQKCVICPVEKTFHDGQSHQSEEEGIAKDGTKTHWIVRTSPIRNKQGEIIAAMEMNLDITQTKHLEERLKASEKKYQAIFNNIPNPVFILDKNTLEILNCNNSIDSVYGYKREEIIGQSFLIFFKEDDKKYYASKLKSSKMINRAVNLNKERKTLYVNIRVSPSNYLEEGVLLVTTGDITKYLEVEQQLIQASKMATLGEMATGVAHELNQPLSVIKTASNFFIKKINKKEPIQDEIMVTLSKEIDSHVDRATKIINHMREFGRESEVSLREVDINTTLKRAFEIFSQQLKVRGIEVDWEIERTLPTIQGDPDRLEQVFINLLINARDAIEEKWERKSSGPGDKKITLKTATEVENVRVEVKDTGSGIPRAILDKIFEPFFTTKEVGRGTGLGLSISYGIIQDCGGSIRAVSKEGQGSCFILEFPISGKNRDASKQK